MYASMTAAFGGLLPDLDHPSSALGRRLPVISLPLSALVGHRGVTHSLFAVVVMFVGLLLTTALPAYAWGQGFIAPLLLGYLSHITGDAMTPSGVPLFWPRRKTYSLNLFKTWSRTETVFVGAFTLGVAFFGGVVQNVLEDTMDQMNRLPMGRLLLDAILPR